MAEPAAGPAAPPVAELLVEHQLDLAADGAWLDQLAQDIAAAGEDGAPLRFRLNPETLGSLRVEITQARDGAAVRLTADTEAARAIIADAQPRLIAEARAQGVRISEAHVDLGQGGASGDPRRGQGPQNEPQLRTARLLQDEATSDGNPTSGRSDRFA
jgi:flagellar hook-length control protein FliK